MATTVGPTTYVGRSQHPSSTQAVLFYFRYRGCNISTAGTHTHTVTESIIMRAGRGTLKIPRQAENGYSKMVVLCHSNDDIKNQLY